MYVSASAGTGRKPLHVTECDVIQHGTTAQQQDCAREGKEKGSEQQLGGVPCEQCDANMCDIGEVRKRPETGWDTACPSSSTTAAPSGFPSIFAAACAVLCVRHLQGTCRHGTGGKLLQVLAMPSQASTTPRPPGGIIIAL